MVYRWNKITKLSALGACCSLAVWIQLDERKSDKKPPCW